MSDTLSDVRTTITGVMSGPEAKLRQMALAILGEQIAEEPTNRKIRYVDLVTEWDNPYDGDAIRVMADIPDLGGRVQLGYVKNAQTLCNFCQRQLERNPTSGICPECGTKGQLERVGIATKLSQAMRADPNSRWYAEILEITGGKDGKNYGCNLRIAKVWKKSTSQVQAETPYNDEGAQTGRMSSSRPNQSNSGLAEPQPPGSYRRQYDF
jgi:hypothetical protein